METHSTSQLSHEASRWLAVKILIGGILGMAVAIGIGRFAYTPVLPLMQRDLGMTNAVAGWLAGVNFLGYLVGAIACTVSPRIITNRYLSAFALLLCLATTVLMGFTVSPLWWGVLRGVSGVVSAVLFIVIVAEVSSALASKGYSHWVGSLYGGIGLGIAISGLLIPQFDKMGDWTTAWIGIGLVAVVLAVVGIVLGRKRELIHSATIKINHEKLSFKRFWLLVMTYFFEGFGYVVSATFIVAIIAVTPGLESVAPYSWVVVGAAAAVSTILWPAIARRIGCKQALFAAYVIQFFGILVCMYADTVIEVLFAAISFGGTFLGIVALTLAEGARRTGGKGMTAAVLTTSFGVGQVFGPVIAGVLADHQAGFIVPLFIAATSVGLAALCTAFDGEFNN